MEHVPVERSPALRPFGLDGRTETMRMKNIHDQCLSI